MKRVLLLAAAASLVVAYSPAAHAGPTVAVLPRTTQLEPAGQALTIRGSGFSRDANGGVGIYVVFGPKGDDYSTNADRYQAAKWIRSAALGGSGQSELRAGGTFEVTLPDLKARYEDANGALVDCLRVTCYVMTFTAHGVPDRGHDTFTPVAFATGKPAPVGKAVTPYRPSRSPSPPAPAPSRPAAGSPVASAAPARPAPSPTAAAGPATLAPPVATAAAPSMQAAAPAPAAQPARNGVAPFAAVVVAGLGAGATGALAARRRTRVAR